MISQRYYPPSNTYAEVFAIELIDVAQQSYPKILHSMHQKLAVRLNMYIAVEGYGNKHPELELLSPNFGLAFTSFKLKIPQILEVAHKEMMAEKENAERKSLEKNKLCKAGSDVKLILYTSFERSLGNAVQHKAAFFYDELLILKDDMLAKQIQEIHNTAAMNLPLLGNYGITASLLEVFQAMIADYLKLADPKEGVVFKAIARRNIKKIFRETDAILKDHLDKSVASLKKTNQNFFNGYKTHRLIIS